MDQRHEWFKDGARAFRSVQSRYGRAHLLPPEIDLYPCPLCLRDLYVIGAIEAGELTREHVPPHSLGGRWLALTCRSCNNKAGTFFDAEAEKQERMRSFLSHFHPA
ncbi:HNH endonuclease [Actinoplanes campanulatus]|uniref:HNH endonuclease n=2 Tax=Actinoplanes campanulatus TaxID=113559 RepID=UPI00338A9FE0